MYGILAPNKGRHPNQSKELFSTLHTSVVQQTLDSNCSSILSSPTLGSISNTIGLIERLSTVTKKKTCDSSLPPFQIEQHPSRQSCSTVTSCPYGPWLAKFCAMDEFPPPTTTAASTTTPQTKRSFDRTLFSQFLHERIAPHWTLCTTGTLEHEEEEEEDHRATPSSPAAAATSPTPIAAGTPRKVANPQQSTKPTTMTRTTMARTNPI